jgi:hypothetical protein
MKELLSRFQISSFSSAFSVQRSDFDFGPVAQLETERSLAEAEVARSSRAGFIRIFRDRPTGRTPDFGSGDVGSNPSPGVFRRLLTDSPDVA